MIKCVHCGFRNLKGTTFCQHCGSRLRKRFSLFKLSSSQGGTAASMANPQMGLAALTGIQIDKSVPKPTQRHRLVKVLPLEDGRWYCPDCGYLNQHLDSYCGNCGRGFV